MLPSAIYFLTTCTNTRPLIWGSKNKKQSKQQKSPIILLL